MTQPQQQNPDEIYLNLVMPFIAETIYRTTRNHTKVQKSIPMVLVKVRPGGCECGGCEGGGGLDVYDRLFVLLWMYFNSFFSLFLSFSFFFLSEVTSSFLSCLYVHLCLCSYMCINVAVH
jgi:hypothetical protein